MILETGELSDSAGPVQMSLHHQPVMLREVVDLLGGNGKRGGLLVDATLGGGGHAEALLQCVTETRLVGLDQDSEAIRTGTARLQEFGERFRAIHTNFSELSKLFGRGGVDGVLMDLGVSSHQLDAVGRGFSFQQDGPLDMRMDQTRSLTAARLINEWSEKELANIFYKLGEERFSRRIAGVIVEARKHHTIRTTGELSALVARAVGRSAGAGRIHPATRVFQALRLMVNDELDALSEGLDGAWQCLAEGGRLVVISFQSLEDRIVKQRFRQWVQEDGTGELLTRKPIKAGEDEVKHNPRSRSAKLRAIGRIRSE